MILEICVFKTLGMFYFLLLFFKESQTNVFIISMNYMMIYFSFPSPSKCILNNLTLHITGDITNSVSFRIKVFKGAGQTVHTTDVSWSCD